MHLSSFLLLCFTYSLCFKSLSLYDSLNSNLMETDANNIFSIYAMLFQITKKNSQLKGRL